MIRIQTRIITRKQVKYRSVAILQQTSVSSQLLFYYQIGEAVSFIIAQSLTVTIQSSKADSSLSRRN